MYFVLILKLDFLLLDKGGFGVTLARNLEIKGVP
jgi:hypothetical protein